MKKPKKKSKISLGLLGATGRMGKRIQQVFDERAEVSEAFELKFQAAGPQDSRFQLLESSPPDVLIDFSAPTCTLAAAPICAKHGIKMVICTTGFSKLEFTKLSRQLVKVPWIYAPNTSLGIFALKRASEVLTKILSQFDFDISLVEAHHRAKKDAPSGTAKSILENLPLTPSQKELIQVFSIRGGTEMGEHNIHFLGKDERLELSHRALDRGLFAKGALLLAQELVQLRPRNRAYFADEVFSRKFGFK